jgi:hypothetical protein
MAGTIMIGSIPGVWIGAGVAQRLPSGSLRPLLGIVLVAAGLGLLSKAGAGFVTPAMIVGIPSALGLAIWAFTTARTRLEASSTG